MLVKTFTGGDLTEARAEFQDWMEANPDILVARMAVHHAEDGCEIHADLDLTHLLRTAVLLLDGGQALYEVAAQREKDDLLGRLTPIRECTHQLRAEAVRRLLDNVKPLLGIE